ncbi:DUF1223 domain-containing protein [Fulvimarina endophytica]|uniref:DUF1223 domain-containing protein n=1 Tax=Fulvimarina endophytica TaxID=2293836 RepID=UPI001314F01E|nr:DUF1223 domain-containing protein [Fulvimarina endophytica]
MLALVSASLVAGTPAFAQTALEGQTSIPVEHVVELFTSQACSTCPPAGKVMDGIAGEAGVLPLTYHVDYWDYTGWRDTYGSPENTSRQRDYGASFNLSTLFTPQIVIDGREQFVGTKPQEIEQALNALRPIDAGGQALVRARIAGRNLKIYASLENTATQDAMPVLIVVTYDNHASTSVTSGENDGATLTTTHPVRDWRVLGAWSGEPMKVTLPISTLTAGAIGDNGCAVLIQSMGRDGSPGPILSAARIDLSGYR